MVFLLLCFSFLLGVLAVNSSQSTLVESELGTMIINDSEEDEDSATMKRK